MTKNDNNKETEMTTTSKTDDINNDKKITSENYKINNKSITLQMRT
jgi:hypothetical protein